MSPRMRPVWASEPRECRAAERREPVLLRSHPAGAAADTIESWSENWISLRLRASAVDSLYRVSDGLGASVAAGA
jgi:hypothetical protein